MRRTASNPEQIAMLCLPPETRPTDEHTRRDYSGDVAVDREPEEIAAELEVSLRRRRRYSGVGGIYIPGRRGLVASAEITVYAGGRRK